MLPGLLLALLLATAQAAPDQRELWVPTTDLATVLAQNPQAILLTREQYDTLRRDARPDPKDAHNPPRDAALTSASYLAVLDGDVALFTGIFTLDVLTDDWARVPLDLTGVSLGAVHIDGEMALSTEQQKKAQQTLVLRGKGRRTLVVEFTVPVRRADGASRLRCRLPAAAAGALDLTLPGNSRVESPLPFAIQQSDEKTAVWAALSAENSRIDLTWRPIGKSESGAGVLSQSDSFLYYIDSARVRADLGIVLHAALGNLPASFTIRVPAGAKVLQVEGSEIARWSAAEGAVTVDLTSADRTACGFRLLLETPALPADSATTQITLPVPEIDGVSRVSGALGLIGSAGVNIRDITTGPLTTRADNLFDKAIESSAAFVAGYRFLAQPEPPTVALARSERRFDADIDTLVELRQEAIFITRTVTIREQEGETFAIEVALPAGEELLTIRRDDATEPDWRAVEQSVHIRWSERPEKGAPPVFKIRTRIEPADWPIPGDELFTLQDARIPSAERVTGYLAVQLDPAFRIETAKDAGLDPRDGRATPVTGDFAWFRRDDFSLQLRITRRQAETQSHFIGYALPLENALEIHGQLGFTIAGSGVRTLRVQVPAESAALFHFEGAQIAERSLEGDIWTIALQKEVTGFYPLAVTAQLPIAKDAAAFTTRVPQIVPLGVGRVTGIWAVEANTDTEINFEIGGMSELDALKVPRLPGYAPRHRVIGVFGYIGPTYALALEGTRHEPAPILDTVIDRLDLTTIVSTSGAVRHQAALSVRSAGRQYLEIALPPAARLWALSVGGEPAKPVGEPGGKLRVALPATIDPGASTQVGLVYETPGEEWTAHGKITALALEFDARIPVLRSTWKMWVPAGYEYRSWQTNLLPQDEPREPVLLAMPWRVLTSSRPSAQMQTPAESPLSPLPSATPDARSSDDRDTGADLRTSESLQDKLDKLIIRKIDFNEVTIRDAVEFLREQSRELDDELDPARRGVNFVLKVDSVPPPVPGVENSTWEPGSTPITLQLRNVPLGEALRYVTSLANLKYKIEPYAVSIVPLTENTDSLITKDYVVSSGLFGGENDERSVRQFFENRGVQFPFGSSVYYLRESSRLIVRNTPANIDLIDRILELSTSSSPPDADSTPTTPGAGGFGPIDVQWARPIQKYGQQLDTAGLLPVEIDLAPTGVPFTFEGLFAPERVEFIYRDAWSAARRVWIWLVIGGLLYLVLGRRRPWLALLWGMLVLTAIPLCIWTATTPICNALLAGWFVAFVAGRIAAWFVFRRRAPAREEVLA